jgi:hypothetical protein
MVADAIGIEPVSTPELPANREKNRDFSGSGLLSNSNVLVNPMIWRP